MSRDSATSAARNKRIRQDALRDQLSSQGHLQHVIDILGKISDEDKPLEKEMVDRFKIVIDTKMKLVGKYLPDLKQQEIAMTTTELTPEQWLEQLDEPDREAEEKEA